MLRYCCSFNYFTKSNVTLSQAKNVAIKPQHFPQLHIVVLVVQHTHGPKYDYDDYNFGSNTDSLTLTVSDAAGNSSTDSVTINIVRQIIKTQQ